MGEKGDVALPPPPGKQPGSQLGSAPAPQPGGLGSAGETGHRDGAGPQDGLGRQRTSGCERQAGVLLCLQSGGNKPYINLARSTALIFKK